MKSLKTLALVFATALITIGAVAQTSTQQNTGTSTNQPNGTSTTSGGTQTQTQTVVRKEKEKDKVKPNGTEKTVVKSKPTKKEDVSNSK